MTDEIEGMIAGQAVAMHHAAMECFRRAILPDQHPEAASRRDGANLAREMTDMLEALDRKRGKGPQIVNVERIIVHEGRQAIVGSVQVGALHRLRHPLELGRNDPRSRVPSSAFQFGPLPAAKKITPQAQGSAAPP